MHTASKMMAILAIAAGTLTPVSSQAGTLYNGWNYAIDSLNDGSGGSMYEYRGLAFKELGDTNFVAVSSSMPPAGNVLGGARNGSVQHGDVFFNFSGHNLNTPGFFNDPLVFGVRFDGLNDSLNNVGGSNTTLGLFKDVTVQSYTTANSGYATLQAYVNAGFGRSSRAMGDLDSTSLDVIPYLGNGIMYPNILSGTKIGDIALLTRSDLAIEGLNFGHFPGADPSGNSVFGFSFDRILLPEGTFTAHLLQECINDGVALKGANVPEPDSLALACCGLLTAGVVVFRPRRRRRS